MENIRVHPKGFKFLFYLCHGSAAIGFIMLTGVLLQIIPTEDSLIIWLLMISIPFFVVPPELIILLKDQKLIFRNRMNYSMIPFKDISMVKASACSIEIKNHENNTLLEIHKKHFKNIDLLELSEYIRFLLSGNQKVDPMKYTSVKFTGCKFLAWCKSVLSKTL
jgi:hypothetical protein